MKNIYTLDWDAGHLLRYNGAAWSAVGTFVPPDWSNLWQDRACAGTFVYQSKLHTRWVNTNDGVRKAHVGVLGADVAESAQCDLGSYTSYKYEAWGEPFLLKGKVYWFARVADSYSHQYLHLYVFDGSALTRRRCDEMGRLRSLGNTNTLGDPNGFDNNPGASAMTCKVVPFRDRLLLAPTGGTGGNYGNYFFNDAVGQFTIDDANRVTLGWLDGYNTTAGNWYFSNGSDIPFEAFRYGRLAACEYQGKLYSVNHFGEVFATNLLTGNRTQVLDLTDNPGLAVPGGPWTSTGTTDQNWTLYVPNSNYFPMLLGGRVVIQDYNGTGQPQTGYVIHTNNSSAIRLVNADGVRLDTQTANRTFTARWGFDRRHSSDYQACSTFVSMVVYANKLYILGLAGRTVWADAAGQSPPWTLTVWDGIAATHYSYPNGSSFWAMGGAEVKVDEAAGLAHIFYHDQDANTVAHATLNLTSFVLSQVGTAYGRDGQTRVHEIPPGAFALYDAYDVTAAITGATVNMTAGTVTLTYKLYSANPSPDTATVKVQYNSGNGWLNATAKAGSEGVTNLAASAAGTGHGFIHDAMIDLGSGFAGSLNYRVVIVSQSRN